MQNNYYYPQPPYYNPQQYIDEQKRSEFKKTCSNAGFNISFVFLLNFLILPFAVFLLPAKNGGSIQGYDSISYYFFNSLYSFLGFFIFQIIFIKVTKLNFNELFPFNRTPVAKFGPLMIIGYSIFTVANYATTLINANFSLFGIDDGGAVDISGSGRSPLEIIVFFVSIALVPALTEEFAFRGVILGSLRKYGDGFAIFASSLLFGLMHGNLVQIPFAFIGGLALGYLRVYTNSMWPSMVLHFLNNGISVAVTVLMDYIDVNIINMGFSVFIILLLIFALVSMIYLSKKEKNLFSFKSDKETNYKFPQKIKTFLLNPGMILCLIMTVAMIALSMIQL